jgi:hypothetical protein
MYASILPTLAGLAARTPAEPSGPGTREFLNATTFNPWRA